MRLGAVLGGVVFVASCDTRLPTVSVATPSGSTSSTTNANAPTVSIDTPVVNSLANVGDSILVVVRLHGAKSLRNVSLEGLTLKGSADLGTLTSTVRYTTINVPPAGAFRPGLKDTTIRRFLKPVSLADTTLDSLIVRAIVTDTLGLRDTATTRIDIVTGPKVAIIAPTAGDSTPAGIGLTVTAKVTDPDGVARVTMRVQGEPTWPTKLDTSIVQTVTGSPRDVTVSGVARIPIDAPVRSRVTITATAVSVNGHLGASGSVVVFVRNASAAQPLVNQTVTARSELTDSVTISARGDGIAAIGFVARDSLGNPVVRDSVLLTQPFAGNASRSLSLIKIPVVFQGHRVFITGFAVDQSGRTGYAVKASTLTPAGSLGSATGDSTLIVYGHTYKMPQSRSGIVGDVVWDAPRENVILSNMAFNRLEIFHSKTGAFEANGVAVGSMPWGLAISATDPGTLLVANSGGTNISRVSLTGLTEVTDQRIRTRGTYLFTVDETRDEATGKLHENASDPIIYSDRPQYIGQLSNGIVFFSTRPTTEAPKGSIRYLDPKQAFPDPKPIIIYRRASSSITQHVVVNADSVFSRSGAAADASDAIVIYDHQPGTNLPSDSVRTTAGLDTAIMMLRTLKSSCSPNCSDVYAVTGVDITDAGVTDTTYVALSGDRNWIAFGEGHTAGAGIIFMASAAGYFSPPITQVDLTNNAAEKVNGLALDATGLTVAAHGSESFFASVDIPFHLRLQGKFANVQSGAGIVFHPQANGNSGDVSRTAYVATGNQTVEIVDVFHYLSRGRLPIKTNLYGPLRAALPTSSDPPDVVLKLFGVSADGLVVIQLRASDILPSP